MIERCCELFIRGSKTTVEDRNKKQASRQSQSPSQLYAQIPAVRLGPATRLSGSEDLRAGDGAILTNISLFQKLFLEIISLFQKLDLAEILELLIVELKNYKKLVNPVCIRWNHTDAA